MDDLVRAGTWVALRLPSGQHKITQVKPKDTISLGKFGSFNTNELLGRPFYHTYEILEASSDGHGRKRLRIVPASELLDQDAVSAADLNGDQPDLDGEDDTDKAEFEVVDQSGKVLMRTNQNIFDQTGAQKLTTAEIEELKKAESASGRDIIAKIMESHSELDKKTAFSLAKYTTRKARKYLRRFVPLPLDVSMLAHFCLYEKDASKTMDLRDEMLSLALSWSNVHFTDHLQTVLPDLSQGRWLLVDETGGLMVAALAERLGILHPYGEVEDGYNHTGRTNNTNDNDNNNSKASVQQSQVIERHAVEANGNSTETAEAKAQQPRGPPPSVLAQESHMTATHNTINLIHANPQPNLGLLSYFSYDLANSTPSHPLHRHLKTASWLQLLHPEHDALYIEPQSFPPEVISTWKSNKRGTYYKKRRRWERTRAVVDEFRAGGFDGALICSPMTPISPVRHILPLLRGGAPLVVYHPNIEPLTELADFFSSSRRSAFTGMSEEERDVALSGGEEGDFPINPTLLINPTIFTARIRPWQVLPGRTHPLMTGLGGPQGYLFTGYRVVPIEGEKVEARGSYKRRKTGKDGGSQVEQPKAAPAGE